MNNKMYFAFRIEQNRIKKFCFLYEKIVLQGYVKMTHSKLPFYNALINFQVSNRCFESCCRMSYGLRKSFFASDVTNLLMLLNLYIFK